MSVACARLLLRRLIGPAAGTSAALQVEVEAYFTATGELSTLYYYKYWLGLTTINWPVFRCAARPHHAHAAVAPRTVAAVRSGWRPAARPPTDFARRAGGRTA